MKGKTVLMLVVWLALVGMVAGALAWVAHPGPWEGYAYRLNCCPAGDGPLCYLEEGRIGEGWPGCPEGLVAVWLQVERP